jgi:hypothetical protein
MLTETDDLPPPVNHVFVDYENVHAVDAAIIGSKTVHLTLLLGAQKTKLDATVVEKLLHHAANVELIRLKSSGRDALDFALAYYLGRAVLADPCGYFHIISKDTGYDPLIEHLRSKHINVRRHDSFATLTFSWPAKLAAPIPSDAALKPKLPSKPKVQSPIVDGRVTRLLEHLSKFPATRPKNKDRLVSLLVAQLGNKITETEALNLVKQLGQDGHLTIGQNGAVSYHLKSGSD